MAMTLVMREGQPVRDAYGRVRVDVDQQYEDWVPVEDLPEDLASLIPTMLVLTPTDATEAAPVAEIGGSPKPTPEPVTERSGDGVTQQQLAAALAAQLTGDRGNGGTTRKQQAQASPEEQAANLRRLEALATKAEAEAALAQAKAQRAQADADSAPADSVILLRLRQSAEITRLSRNLIADSVAAAEDAHEVTLLTLERQAAQEAITHRREIQAEKWRRRRLGITGWQLFLVGLAGWIVGGLVVGGIAGGEAVAAVMIGHAAGAFVAVYWRVHRGRAQEWREGEAQRREAYQSQQQESENGG